MEIVDADSIFRALEDISASESPPSLIHRDDDPLVIQHGDVRGECVENSGLLFGLDMTQLLLGAAQQEGPTITVRDRVDFTCSQFLKAPPCLVQGLDQCGNFIRCFRQKYWLYHVHAVMGPSPKASKTG